MIGGSLTPARMPPWPTPHARDFRTGMPGRFVNQERSNDLNDAVVHRQTWPTPTASEGTGAQPNKGRSGGISLREAVARTTWPTPRQADYKGATSQHAKMKAENRGFSPNLPEEVASQEPNGGQLNPTWVEWLMGFPAEWTALKD